MGTVPKPFISYAREDQAAANRLVAELREHHVDPWFDVEKLLPGQNWKHVIREAPRHSTHFIALLSRASVNKRGFVQKELRHALELLGEFPPGDIFLIPVRLEPVEVQHHELGEIQRVDLFDDRREALQKILAALRFTPNRARHRAVPENRVRRARQVALIQDQRTATWLVSIGVNDLLPVYESVLQALNTAKLEPTYLFSSRGATKPPPTYNVIVAGSAVSLITLRQVLEAVYKLGDWYLQLWETDFSETQLAIGAYGYGGMLAAPINESLVRNLSKRSFTRSKLREWINAFGIVLNADFRPVVDQRCARDAG